MRAVLTALFLAAALQPLTAPLAWSAPLADLATAARSLLGADQGVYIESADGTVLLAQAASSAVHPASVSKIPTTLALLRKFGPDYRFTTTLGTNGALVAGTLRGDLWVESDGDPSLVDEDALLVAQRLNQLGIESVAGGLQVRGALTFDWLSDAQGLRFQQALGGTAPPAAWSAVQALLASSPLPTALSPPQIRFQGTPSADTGSVAQASDRPLLVHRSQPLMSLLKALNDYSNNIFKPLADEAGGAAAVQALARSAVPAAMRAEIILGDGAGTDARNRLSPRAAVRLLRALEAELSASGHSLYDILPVAGVDDGTLHDRLNAPDEVGRVVGKTGTFGSYGASALVGAIATRDRGTVYFAILNHGVPVVEARHRQDRFVQALLQRLHTAPWSYQRDQRPAITRAEIVMAP